jgi:hypothetical protein
MQIMITLLLIGGVLGGIIFFARRFLKPVKGPLPDCCAGRPRTGSPV